jgi:glycosyltransferase involved in cell wall biosynthesis
MSNVAQHNARTSRARKQATQLRAATTGAAHGSAERLRVLMLGPDLTVRGGISAVEQSLLDALAPTIEVTHIPTMVEGSKWRKLLTFARAAIRGYGGLQRRPDVVHIHFASKASSVRKMLLARLALARGAKVIMHAHGGAYRDYWERISGMQRAAILQVLRRVHRLIVLGETWREFFAAIGVPPDKIVVLPNPVVLPKVLPRRLARTHVHLVYLGRIVRNKGAFDLVEAIAQLPLEILTRVRLVVAGDGEIARLRAAVERLGIERIVEVRDWISTAERDRLLASADVFVLPSYAEGLPMSLLEAMAWSLPVICTAVGSIPEYVRHEGNGMLVRPGDIAQLCGTIARMVQNDGERVRMGESARKAVEPLSLDLYADKVAALYRSAARAEAMRTASEPCRQ